VVVHGGGRQINALSARLGFPVVKINGLRVTTPEVAEVVQMVLCGPVRSRLVSALEAAGLRAVGVSGADGGLLEARITDPDLGRVGEISRVSPALLDALSAAGFTPVVAPVCVDAMGPLNVNADEAATAVALALSAGDLLFVSDVPGVLVDGVPQASLTAREVEERIAAGDVKDGMAVKLRCAARAFQRGVAVVRIGDLTALTDPVAGTRLLAGAAHPA
jgi:acetylglutamate kinase